MTPLRIYLLAGLLAHKFVWELLKRRPGRETAKPRKSLPSSLASVKAVKIAMLLGIIVQTLAPEVLPITNEPSALRVVGVFVYTLGLLMAILSRIHLGRNWSDIEAGRVLREQAVVSTGTYAYVRHPIYVGDLLLLFGLELSLNSWLVIAVASTISRIADWRYDFITMQPRGSVYSICIDDGHVFTTICVDATPKSLYN